MPKLANTTQDLNQAIDLQLNGSQLESLFLGYAWSNQPSGYLFDSTSNTIAQVGNLRKLWASQRMQQYFDSYGRLTGHLVWHLADEKDEHNLLRGRLPALEVNNPEATKLWILSVAMSEDSRSSVFRDICNLSIITGSPVQYIRRKGKKLIGQKIDLRQSKKSVLINEPIKKIPPGLELPVIQLVARRKKREGDMLLQYSKCSYLAPESLPLERAWRPLMLDQYAISYDEFGIVCGLITWAWIANSDYASFADSAFTCHVSRWRSGRKLMIIDVIGNYHSGLNSAIGKGLLTESDLKSAEIFQGSESFHSLS